MKVQRPEENYVTNSLGLTQEGTTTTNDTNVYFGPMQCLKYVKNIVDDQEMKFIACDHIRTCTCRLTSYQIQTSPCLLEIVSGRSLLFPEIQLLYMTN